MCTNRSKWYVITARDGRTQEQQERPWRARQVSQLNSAEKEEQLVAVVTTLLLLLLLLLLGCVCVLAPSFFSSILAYLS